MIKMVIKVLLHAVLELAQKKTNVSTTVSNKCPSILSELFVQNICKSRYYVVII